MKKFLFFGVPALSIIVVNLFYGSVISWMLSVIIIACLLYFAVKLEMENFITKSLARLEAGDERIQRLMAFDKKWKTRLGFALITFTFLSAVVGISLTMNPGGQHPWFTTNDYNGLSNSGIEFTSNLKVTSIATDGSAGNGQIIFSKGSGEDGKITFDHFYQPVVSLNATNRNQLNRIFDQPITNSFTLRNQFSSIDVSIDKQRHSIFSRLFGKPKEEMFFHLKIHSSDPAILSDLNLPPPFLDVVTLTTQPLEKGMSLFNLFLDNQDFLSKKNETYQVLEKILLQLGDTYLMAETKGDQTNFFLVPDKGFFDNQYGLFVHQEQISPHFVNTAEVPLNQPFFIGFNNEKKPLHLGRVKNEDYGISKDNYLALLFDYPNTYLLKSPGNQKRGDKNIRFITNEFNYIIASNLQEGFYFTTYNLKVDDDINGTLDYITGRPNSPLSAGITDNLNSGQRQAITQNRFSLKSGSGQIFYLFDIRDFSQNGFALPKVVFYLSLTYLAFILLITFWGGKKIDRLEPVILSVILSLSAIRYLMFWRVATFPPLNDITKHELDNTLLNFDFNLGIHWPVPVTLILILLFVVGIILFRTRKDSGKTTDWNKIFHINTTSLSALQKSYGIFLLACLFIFLFNKKILHVEFITRIISIVLPLVGYWYFSRQANRGFRYAPMNIQGLKSKFLIQFKAYFYYLFNNPAFILTLFSLTFFALCDRGFAILFALFILLKNIFINFLKKPLDPKTNSVKRMLYKPNNFWIYAFCALIVYLVVLAFKSLFYYLLLYKLWVISLVLALSILFIFLLYPEKRKLRKASLGILGFWVILMAIPYTRNNVDQQIINSIKHVQYRASIITQPIGELLQQNEYTSFNSRKIIETAENQWFINSYITKKFDPEATINLRPHTRVGVDYSTQTRDVVVARYIISEMGNLVMYLILTLFVLPLILYLVSYRVHMTGLKDGATADLESYSGLIPLVLLFTLALFVWLTATNRFVFFGQDFPFLSLTSRISVLLPLILLGIVLTRRPTTQHAFQINLQNSAVKYVLFFGVIVAFALTTIKQNELSNRNFTVVMSTAEQHIDGDLNTILQDIQDSLALKRIHPSYNQLIWFLSKDNDFQDFIGNQIKDKYTQSILNNLISRPSSALKLNNPLFIIYDNGRYQAEYNQNLYLELPPVEGRNIWNGNISESLQFDSVASASLTLNSQSQNVTLPYYYSGSGVQLALLPASWLGNQKEHTGLLDITDASAAAFIYRNKLKNLSELPTAYTQPLVSGDLATIYKSSGVLSVGFKNSGNVFALNKWINGSYRCLYPLKEENFWVYNFANSVKSSFSNHAHEFDNVYITIDYLLSQQIQSMVDNLAVTNAKNRRFNFSAIAADGNGNIRFMADYVTNRYPLDPNNQAAIFALQQKQFFYSNARNERDQWGNRNLLSLYLGPGSSVKPLTSSVIASQVNAGWEKLGFNPPSDAQLTEYGGLKLRLSWENEEHYRAPLDMPKFLEVSSNFYQSVMMFMGAYEKEDFTDGKTYSLSHILTRQGGANNSFPYLTWSGSRYYLPNYQNRKGNWPKTNKSKKRTTFFGNQNSLIANGLEQNTGLQTKDESTYLRDVDVKSFVDSGLYYSFQKNAGGGNFWSFPEPSSFLQSQRVFNDITGNFNLGLKTAALGGYPYRLTPFKMLEMYLSLFTQNKDFHLGVTQKNKVYTPWSLDATWTKSSYDNFLSANIFSGMYNVIYGGSGTARALSGLKDQLPDLYFYAKTGTINEQASGIRSSRRLIVIATDKDLRNPVNIGHAKMYGWFFATDNTGDFDWGMLNRIITQTAQSATFRHYFNQK